MDVTKAREYQLFYSATVCFFFFSVDPPNPTAAPRTSPAIAAATTPNGRTKRALFRRIVANRGMLQFSSRSSRRDKLMSSTRWEERGGGGSNVLVVTAGGEQWPARTITFPLVTRERRPRERYRTRQNRIRTNRRGVFRYSYKYAPGDIVQRATVVLRDSTAERTAVVTLCTTNNVLKIKTVLVTSTCSSSCSSNKRGN